MIRGSSSVRISVADIGRCGWSVSDRGGLSHPQGESGRSNQSICFTFYLVSVPLPKVLPVERFRIGNLKLRTMAPGKIDSGVGGGEKLLIQKNLAGGKRRNGQWVFSEGEFGGKFEFLQLFARGLWVQASVPFEGCCVVPASRAHRAYIRGLHLW